jgi:hypothetical protein
MNDRTAKLDNKEETHGDEAFLKPLNHLTEAVERDAVEK